MEVIETMVKKDIAIPFNKLFEPEDIEYRFASLKNFLPKDKMIQTEQIFSKILNEEIKNPHQLMWVDIK